MEHLTVRRVPTELAVALEAERVRRGTSLNQAVIDLLTQALGVGGEARSNGLARLSGSWSRQQVAAFERAIDVVEQIDGELWR